MGDLELVSEDVIGSAGIILLFNLLHSFHFGILNVFEK